MPSRPLQATEDSAVPASVDSWLENQIDPWRGAHILQRHWKAIAAGAVIGTLTGLGLGLLQRPMYEAVTTILVGNATSPASALTSRALLQNQTLAAETIADLSLNKPPYELTPQEFTMTVLSLEEIRGANIFRVKVVLPDADKAVEASRHFSHKAVELSRRIVGEEGNAVQSQFKSHLDEATARSRIAEQQLLAFEQVAQVEVLKNSTDSMLEEREKLLALEIDIASEKAKLAAAEQEIKRHPPTMAVARDVDGAEALRRADPPADSKAELLNLRTPYGNPVHETLSFQIALSRTRLAGLERHWQELVTVRRLNSTSFNQLSDLYSRQLEYARLRAAYDLAREVHKNIATRYEQSRTAVIDNMAQLQIVDNPVRPDRPLSRNRVRFAGLGGAAGLILGLGVSLILERRRENLAPLRGAVRSI